MSEQSNSPLDPTTALEPSTAEGATEATEVTPAGGEAVTGPEPTAYDAGTPAPQAPAPAWTEPAFTAPPAPEPGHAAPPPPPAGATHAAPPPPPYPPSYAAPQAAPYGGAPQVQQLAPETEKQIGALAHGVAAAATFFSGGTLGFVAALVIYLVYKDRGPFVRAHAANALNVQIAVGIGLIVSALLMLILVGFIAYPIVWIVGVVLHVIGTVKAMNGEWWTPPLTPQFVK